MSSITTRLSAWFWYLLPANPILVRVVYGMSRRTRHMWLRFGYLSALLMVVMFTLLSLGTSSGTSLADLAKGASKTFQFASITQLALMCFLAPVFTAAAITQERDAQTYNILISTPLSNAQIVIGSLLSRLYFVIVLLIAGLPIFFTTMIYGGVTTDQVLRSFAIAGSTAVLTGSLAITISMIKVGTRRTIFSFFLGIGVYLFSVFALGLWSRTHLPEAPPNVDGQRMSWLAAFHPFLALDVVLNKVQAPDIASVGHYGPLGSYFVAYPQTAYVWLTMAISALLVVISMFFVRRGTREGELTFIDRIAARFGRQTGAERTRKPHQVWANPVAWREAVSRGGSAGRGMTRVLVIGTGLLAAIVLVVYYGKYTNSGFGPAVARTWLANIVAIEFAIVLLVGVNVAGSSLTKDKESRSLDIMLTTPLTSRYIIWGKLRGLVSFVLPMILVPVISLLMVSVFDLIRQPKEPAVHIETGIEIGILLVIFSAYACMLGLHFSLKQKKTVRAVIISVGVLLIANLAAYLFWWTIVTRADVLGAALATATPFTAIRAIIDPVHLFDSKATLANQWAAVRASALVGTLIFAAIHSVVIFSWYKSMVNSFDMVIRKQSGQ